MFIRSFLALLPSIAISLGLLVVPADAQDADAEANLLFVRAATLYRQANDMPADEQAQALAEVRSLLDEIIARYPDSRPGQAIAPGTVVAGIDMSRLPPGDPGPGALDPELAAVLDNLRGLVTMGPARRLKTVIEAFEVFEAVQDIEQARLLSLQILALPEWADVLSPETIDGIRSTVVTADLKAATSLAALVLPPIVKALVDDQLAPHIRAHLDDRYSGLVVQLLKESVDGFTVAAPAWAGLGAKSSPYLYMFGKTAEVLVELDRLNTQQNDLVSQAIALARMNLIRLEFLPHYDFADLLRYKISQDSVASQMMAGSGLNVRAGRKLLITNEMMMVTARQINGMQYEGNLESLGDMVRDFDQTAENKLISWIVAPTVGLDARDVYAEFAAEVAGKLGFRKGDPAQVLADLAAERTALDALFAAPEAPLSDAAADDPADAAVAPATGSDAPPASSTTPAPPSQAALLAALEGGLYAVSEEDCRRPEEDFGDTWGQVFKTVRDGRFSLGYGGVCAIRSVSDDGDALTLGASCLAEGTTFDTQARWRILSATSFEDLTDREATKSYVFCQSLDRGVGAGDAEAQWTEAIVHEGPLTFGVCVQDPTQRCLEDQGFGAETARFIEALEQTESGPTGIPVAFFDTGTVDIALIETGLNSGPRHILLNGNPPLGFGSYAPAQLTRLPMNGVEQRVARRYPRGNAYFSRIIGHRLLPEGSQRFALVSYYSDFCRACPIIGVSVVYNDFTPDGRYSGYHYVGLLDMNGLEYPLRLTPQLLRRRPDLVQYALNIRGYDAGPMDAQLGERSRSALVQFQIEAGLNSGTGQLDEATLRALSDPATVYENGITHSSGILELARSIGTGVAQSGLPAAARCNPGPAVPSDQIVSLWASRILDGQTASGANWRLRLGPPDATQTGRATFTNARGETSEGFWSAQNTELCQSYTGGASWSCHTILRCTGAADTFAMRNDRGEVSSVLRAAAEAAPAGPPGAGDLSSCQENPTAICLTAAAVLAARQAPNSAVLAEIMIEAGILSAMRGDTDRAGRLAREAEGPALSRTPPDFHTLVDLGALSALLGDQTRAEQLARMAEGQTDNALSQIAGRLVREGRSDLAIPLADRNRSAVYRESVFEDAAVAAFEAGETDSAMTLLNRARRASTQSSILAQFASASFRSGLYNQGLGYLQDARSAAAKVDRRGPEDMHLARAFALAGAETEAMALAASASDTWKPYILGHTAAGAAEAGSLDLALDLVRQLTFVGEYNRRIAITETTRALIRENRLDDFPAFAASLAENGADLARSDLAAEQARAGDIDAALATIGRIGDRYVAHLARSSVAAALAGNGRAADAMALIEETRDPVDRAWQFIDLAREL